MGSRILQSTNLTITAETQDTSTGSSTATPEQDVHPTTSGKSLEIGSINITKVQPTPDYTFRWIAQPNELPPDAPSTSQSTHPMHTSGDRCFSYRLQIFFLTTSFVSLTNIYKFAH